MIYIPVLRLYMGLPLLIWLLAGCRDWKMAGDLDGDGFTKEDGDCWDYPQGPTVTDASGQEISLAGADIYPGAKETWYNGVDEDCKGDDDYDQDGDGHAIVPVGDDCFDGVEQQDFSNPAGVGPELVHPDNEAGVVEDIFYDGLDANCDGNDGDADGDGYWVADYEVRAGVSMPSSATGGDCDDENAGINPGVAEDLSTDVDENCDGSGCDADQDGVQGCGGQDCDDQNADISPLEQEIWHDGVDQDCDGNDDDEDGDGVGLNEGDCHDDPEEVFLELNGFSNLTAADISPEATERFYDGIDQDCSGDTDFDQDGDGFGAALYGQGEDCDDEDAAVWPGAVEFWYNGVDEDCDGNDTDQDGDGEEYDLRGGTDCNDQDAAINAAATEACDSVDNDCDSDIDEQDASGCLVYLQDSDGDGAPATSEACLCEATGLYTVLASENRETDCNDADSSIYPEAVELCATSADDNCSGSNNDQNASGCSLFYGDADGDGAGNAAMSACFCISTLSYPEATATDCDDSSSEDYPGATELCNGDDEDCDGAIDNGLTLYYPDLDEDGYGDDQELGSCDQTIVDTPVANNSDCDDTERWVYPGATEICDQQQNDCTQSGWTESDETGLVTSFDGSGTPTNESWNTTDPTSPQSYTITTPGLELKICQGTYYQAIVMTTSGLDGVTITGLYGAAATELSGGGNLEGPLLDIGNSQEVWVEGLTFRDAAGTGSPYGAAIRVATSSVEQGSALAPNLSLVDCMITGNSDTSGAGIAIGRSESTTLEYGYVLLENSVVSSNTTSNEGGGAWILNGTLECSNSSFTSNSASSGGAVFLYDNAATLVSSGSLISSACDWGTGASDNSPGDISGTGISSYNYPGTYSFSCSLTDGCF
jgi:hypothetical protein